MITEKCFLQIYGSTSLLKACSIRTTTLTVLKQIILEDCMSIAQKSFIIKSSKCYYKKRSLSFFEKRVSTFTKNGFMG